MYAGKPAVQRASNIDIRANSRYMSNPEPTTKDNKKNGIVPRNPTTMYLPPVVMKAWRASRVRNVSCRLSDLGCFANEDTYIGWENL